MTIERVRSTHVGSNTDQMPKAAAWKAEPAILVSTHTCMPMFVYKHIDPHIHIHTKARRESWVSRGTLEGQRACSEGYDCSIRLHWIWQCEHIKLLLEHLCLLCRLPTALVLLCVATDWKCNHSLLSEALPRAKWFFSPIYFLIRS